MTNYKASDYLSGNFVKKEDLFDDDLTVTIVNVESIDFTDKDSGQVEHRLQLTFDNEKKLTLNSTNLQILIKRFGNLTQAWLGQAIVLYFDESVAYAGRLVGGIRIRVPKTRTPAPPPVAPEADGPVPF